jgi:membrane protease YdiL (CAAX protease family)
MTSTIAAARLSWPRVLVLHLLPGLAAVAVFAVSAPLLARAGLPPVWGMFLAVGLVIAPIELGIVLRYGRDGVDLTPPLRRDLVRRLLPTLLVAAVAPGLVQWAEPTLSLPDWWSLDPRPASSWVGVVTIVGWLLAFVLIGPVVEEVYFRGFLLHRIPSFAVVTNAGLFAVYHLWQPHTWLTVFVFALPLAVVASRPRGVVIAAVTHVTVNAIAFAALLAGLAER